MPTTAKLTLAGKQIPVEIFDPPVPGAKAVVVAHGTAGLEGRFGDLIRECCDDLARAGLQVLLPRYFDRTDTQPGFDTVYSSLENGDWKMWVQTLVDAIAAARKPAGTKVGLLGFSLGAHQVLHTAATTPVEAVVDFFGPITRYGAASEFPRGEGLEFTAALASRLPMTLIHHGRLDGFVLPSESQELAKWLRSSGRLDQLIDDYPCGHPGQPEFEWTAAIQKGATATTATFLNHQLV